MPQAKRCGIGEIMKKLLSLIIILSLVLASNVTVFATTLSVDEELKEKQLFNLNEELYNAENGISDIAITEEIRNSVEATFLDEEGNLTPLKVDVTIKEILLNQRISEANKQGKIYALTMRASTVESDSGESSNSIPISGHLTMFWQDNFGVDNKLLSATVGYVKNTTGIKISGGGTKNFIRYGKGHNAGTYSKTKELTDAHIANGFEWSNINFVSRQFHVNTQNTFSYNGKEGILKLHVNTSYI